MYTKGDRTLRIEGTVHNARKTYLGTSPEKYPDIINRLKEILERFVEVITYVHSSYVSSESIDQLPKPSQLGKARVGGVDRDNPRLRHVMNAVITLSAFPGEFKTSDVMHKVRQETGCPRTTTRSFRQRTT